jgi:tetratricopeptide (TPR) repeat protein
VSELREDHGQQPETPADATDSAGGALPKPRLPEGAIDFNRGIDTAQVYISAFLLVAAGVLLYAGSLGTPFQGRDYPLFVDNAPIQQVTTVSQALESMPEAPVTVIDLALNASLLGTAPFGLHLFSLLMHVACGLLLYLIARRLFGEGQPEPVAMAAGLLLVLHPAAVQNVLYLPGRAELHATLFALAALYFFLRATPSAAETRPLPMALALVCYVVAAGSSPVAIGLPVVALWIDLLRNGSTALASRWMVHGAAFLAIPLVLTAILADMPAPAAADLSLPGKTALALQQALYAIATGGEAAPVFSGLPESVAVTTWAVAGGMLLAALTLLAARSAAALIPLWLLASVTGAAALAQPEGWTAPHGAYLSLAGAALILPWALSLFRAPGVRTVMGLAMAALLVVAGAAAYQRTVAWHAPETLWSAAAESHPDATAPWQYLGRIAEDRARTAQEPDQARHAVQEALAYYEEAAARDSRDLDIARSVARLTLELGRVPQAIERLDALARRAPFDGEVARLHARAHDLALRFGAMETLPQFAASTGAPDELLNRIRMTLAQQPPDPAALAEAATFLTRAAREQPLSSHARAAAASYARAETLGALEPGDHVAWALMNFALGNVPRAAEALARVDLADSAAMASEFNGLLQRQLGLAAQSEQQSAELIATPERQLEALHRRAQALLLRGEHTAAAYLLENLVKREETREAAWQELGALRAGQGHAALFLAEHGGHAPPVERIWQTLALRCMALGHWEAARAYLAAPEAGLTPLEQEMAIGDAAFALRMLDRAEQLLRATAANHPEAPEPWLRLADLFLAQEQPAQAASLLAEAEKRAANPDELEMRRTRIREGGADPGVLPEDDEAVRTIIR